MSTPLGKAAVALDERFAGAKGLKKAFNKVFPDHWSFMLGEIALYSFIVVLLTGVFLTAQAAGRRMVPQKSGLILATSSIYGLTAGAKRAVKCLRRGASQVRRYPRLIPSLRS